MEQTETPEREWVDPNYSLWKGTGPKPRSYWVTWERPTEEILHPDKAISLKLAFYRTVNIQLVQWRMNPDYWKRTVKRFPLLKSGRMLWGVPVQVDTFSEPFEIILLIDGLQQRMNPFVPVFSQNLPEEVTPHLELLDKIFEEWRAQPVRMTVREGEDDTKYRR